MPECDCVALFYEMMERAGYDPEKIDWSDLEPVASD